MQFVANGTDLIIREDSLPMKFCTYWVPQLHLDCDGTNGCLSWEEHHKTHIVLDGNVE